MSINEFYELTYREATLIVDRHTASQKVLLDNYSIVVYSAIGQALGGEKWQALFTAEQEDEATAEPVKTVYTKEEKQQELNALKELFNN